VATKSFENRLAHGFEYSVWFDDDSNALTLGKWPTQGDADERWQQCLWATGGTSAWVLQNAEDERFAFAIDPWDGEFMVVFEKANELWVGYSENGLEWTTPINLMTGQTSGTSGQGSLSHPQIQIQDGLQYVSFLEQNSDEIRIAKRTMHASGMSWLWAHGQRAVTAAEEVDDDTGHAFLVDYVRRQMLIVFVKWESLWVTYSENAEDWTNPVELTPGG